jgi:hypothetical protein
VTDSSTENAIERYQRTLAELAALVGEDGHTSSDRRRDRLVEQVDAERQVLERSAEGRAAIAALLRDPRPAVRLRAATAVLGWDESAARPTLVEIRDSPSAYGLHSITAKHTLLDFDAGS